MGRLKTDMGRAGVPPGDGPLVGLYLLKNGALKRETGEYGSALRRPRPRS